MLELCHRLNTSGPRVGELEGRSGEGGPVTWAGAPSSSRVNWSISEKAWETKASAPTFKKWKHTAMHHCQPPNLVWNYLWWHILTRNIEEGALGRCNSVQPSGYTAKTSFHLRGNALTLTPVDTIDTKLSHRMRGSDSSGMTNSKRHLKTMSISSGNRLYTTVLKIHHPSSSHECFLGFLSKTKG